MTARKKGEVARLILQYLIKEGGVDLKKLSFRFNEKGLTDLAKAKGISVADLTEYLEEVLRLSK